MDDVRHIKNEEKWENNPESWNMCSLLILTIVGVCTLLSMQTLVKAGSCENTHLRKCQEKGCYKLGFHTNELWLICSISCLVIMPWRLMSPGHHQPWYWPGLPEYNENNQMGLVIVMSCIPDQATVELSPITPLWGLLYPIHRSLTP